MKTAPPRLALLASLLFVCDAAAQPAAPPAPAPAAPQAPLAGPWRVATGRSAVRARSGAVASSQPLAAQVGLQVLERGGNAVDAAVAMAATLAVVEPGMSGLGGDAFALVYWARDSSVRALNASGAAPAALSAEALRERGLSKIPMTGPLSVIVPGALLGWVALLKAHGTRPLGELLQPAIAYAEEGFLVPEKMAEDWADFRGSLEADPAARALLLPGGRPPRPGQRLRQPQLAATLRALAQAPDAARLFYHGALGGALVDGLAARGGLVQRSDLAAARADWVTPVRASYRGHQVYQCPPNSQGQAALWALEALERRDLTALAADPPTYYQALIAESAAALARRDRELGDGQRAAGAAGVAPPRLAPAPVGVSSVAGDTTAIVVVDRQRNVVAYTGSLYWLFGSGVLAGDTGILLHNRGAAFRLSPGHPNHLLPGRRPLHSNMPGLVLRGGRPVLALAVVGGDMQALAQVQVLSGLFDLRLGLQEAVEAPRLLLAGPGQVIFDPRLPPPLAQTLGGPGVRAVAPSPPWSPRAAMGGVQAIRVHWGEDEGLEAASDPRKDGLALGY